MTAPRMAYLLYYSCVIRVSFACHSCGVHRIRHSVTAIAPVVLFDYAHPVPVALLGNISKHHASAPASNRERPGEAGAAPRAGTSVTLPAKARFPPVAMVCSWSLLFIGSPA